MSELEMPCQPQFNVEEESQRVRVREIGILEWICPLRLTCPHWENPEDIPTTTVVRNQFAKGTQASLKSTGITLLCMPDVIVRTAVAESGNLYAMGVIGSWYGRGPMSALNCQRQSRHGYGKGLQSQSSSQSRLTPTDPGIGQLSMVCLKVEQIGSRLNSYLSV